MLMPLDMAYCMCSSVFLCFLLERVVPHPCLLFRLLEVQFPPHWFLHHNLMNHQSALGHLLVSAFLLFFHLTSLYFLLVKTLCFLFYAQVLSTWVGSKAPMEYQGFSEELTERAWLQLVRSCTLHTCCCPNFWKERVTGCGCSEEYHKDRNGAPRNSKMSWGRKEWE